MGAKADSLSTTEEILVLAPLGRDAATTCRVLSAAGLHCRPCEDMGDLRRKLLDGAGAVLVTEEALGDENRALLFEALQDQPPWSDLPVTLLLSPGKDPLPTPLRIADILPGHNVTVLRRPVSTTTLVSVMNASLRARRRQYELRALLRQREKQAELLEQRVQARTRRLKQLSEQYEAARDLFFTLFQANPLPIAIARLEDGLFLDVNEAFLRYFKVDAQRVARREAVELQTWLPSSERRKILSLLHSAGSVRNLETVMTDPLGKTRTVLLSAELVSLEGEAAALVTFVDISKRKRAEEKIRELATQLTHAEHEERHRIAHILHDDLQQQLYAVQMQLTFLSDVAPDSLRLEMEAMESIVQTTIETVRNLSVDLSPPILHDEGLVEGIAWIARRMRDQYRLHVDVHADGSFPLSDDGQRVLVFQILRELLFNAVKHAGVSRVEITLQERDEQYRIDVVDEGAGFDPQETLHDADSEFGRGLSTAGERLRLIGGRLEVKSAPQQGTRATIFVPARNL